MESLAVTEFEDVSPYSYHSIRALFSIAYFASIQHKLIKFPIFVVDLYDIPTCFVFPFVYLLSGNCVFLIVDFVSFFLYFSAFVRRERKCNTHLVMTCILIR